MRTLLWSTLALLLLLPAASTAQLEEPDDDSEDLPKRKGPSFFHRPAEESAAAQLALAQRLEADGKLRAAANAYQALVHAWHSSPQGWKAQLGLARVMEERRRYIRAFNEYQYLAENYAGRFPFDDVLEEQARIANHVMSARRAAVGPFKGIAFPDRALPLYAKIVQNAPEWKGAPEAQFRLGTLYQQTKDYTSAVVAFETLRYRYLNAPQIESADFRNAECLYALARSRPRDETTCRDAISALAAFLVGHPDSEDAGAAREMLDQQKEQLAAMYYVRAIFYDRHRKRKPRAALIAYEDFIDKFPTSPLAEKARNRLDYLRQNLELPEEE